MTLPSSGAISLGQVNVELGLATDEAITLGSSAVRDLFEKPTGAIALSDGYGKSNSFAFSIASNQTNANLRTLAISAGWDQERKVVATVNAGVFISSTSSSTSALTVNGAFPNGVALVNNGHLVGRGGNGGIGGRYTVSGVTGNISLAASGQGSKGAPALTVTVPLTVENNGTIAGGGGGASGGGSGYKGQSPSDWTNAGSGGGGGGGRSGTNNSTGGTGDKGATDGGAGTVSNAGPGGAGYISGGKGGDGGDWGAPGEGGALASLPAGLWNHYGSVGNPGAGGEAVIGNANITWVNTGTRYGAIT